MTLIHGPTLDIGFPIVSTSSGMAVFALDATGTPSDDWLCYMFVAKGNVTLSKVRAFTSAMTGTPAATELLCALYAVNEATQEPTGAAIETQDATSAAAGWLEFDGFTTALTAGLSYALVFKNNNATPASNFPTYRFSAGSTGPLTNGGWQKLQSSNGGTTWTNRVRNQMGCRVEFSDGTFDGVPIATITTTAAGIGVYGTRELGAKMTTPANSSLNVRGISFQTTANSGTITGDLRFRLYTGSAPTLQATSFTIPNGHWSLSSNVWIKGLFSSPVTIPPSTIVRVTIGIVDGSGDSSNYVRQRTVTVDNTAGSKALIPFSTHQTYYDGSSWADTDTEVLTCTLLLDRENEFPAASGATSPARLFGGGPIHN